MSFAGFDGNFLEVLSGNLGGKTLMVWRSVSWGFFCDTLLRAAPGGLWAVLGVGCITASLQGWHGSRRCPWERTNQSKA